jgi:hypothetical protein
MDRVCGTHGKKILAYQVSTGTPQGKNLEEDQGVDVKIILKRIFEK